MCDRKAESTQFDPPSAGAFAPSFVELFDPIESPPCAYSALSEGPWYVRSAGKRQWACYSEGDEEPYAVLKQRYLALLMAAALPVAARSCRFQIDASDRPLVLLANGEPAGTMKYRDEELLAVMDGLDGLVHRPWSFAHLMEAAGAPILDRSGRILAQRVWELRQEEALRLEARRRKVRKQARRAQKRQRKARKRVR